jgi:haloalkane dehalogenase
VLDDGDHLVTPAARPHGPRAPIDLAHASWSSEYPFASHWLDVGDSMWMHYVDEGPRDAPVVVLLHGNPTWSFYWRALISALRSKYRCIAPDHLGCGLSDRPQGWSYRLADHIDNVQKLLTHLDVKRFSLVVHDWGGAIGMGVATERPDDVERIVVTNTAAFRSQDIPLSIASCRIPVFGKVAVLGFNGFAQAATFRAVEKKLAPNAKAGLLAPYGNPHDRLATLRFVEDIPMKPSHPSWGRLLRVEEKLPSLAHVPMLVLWGDADFCFTPKFRATWQRHFPHAKVHAWADVGHYVMEDAPDRVLPLVEKFFQDHRS